MSEETLHAWKGREIRICTVPVRYLVSCTSARDAYVAIVRLESGGTVLADWHLPCFERWSSAGEARRAAFEYVVKLVDRGLFDAPAARGADA